MKLLVIQPGASYSTADVYDGIVRQLEMLGHQVIRYNLDTRIARSHSWLNYNWQLTKDQGINIEQPGTADIIYQASSEAILVALRHMVDWVVVFSGMYFHPDAFISMKRARLNVAIIFTESPYDDAKQFAVLPYGDVIFTNDKYSAEAFAPYHRKAFYLPHAFDPTKHSTSHDDSDDVPAHDVVFVGTGFLERIELLSEIDWTGIDLGLYGSYELLEDLPAAAEKLKPYIKGEIVHNNFAASLYRKAKIGLNIHRTSIGFGIDAPRIMRAHSLNPRLYELAANQCFVISDHRPEIDEVFGSLIPTFSNATEAEALIRRWLGDEAGRNAVSSQLPGAVAKHTFYARALQVSRTLMAEGDATWLDTTGVRASSTSAPQEPELLAQRLR